MTCIVRGYHWRSIVRKSMRQTLIVPIETLDIPWRE